MGQSDGTRGLGHRSAAFPLAARRVASTITGTIFAFGLAAGRGCSSGGHMPKVNFVNEKKEIEVPAGSNLRQEARKAGIELYKGLDRYLNCRGLGLCGTCRVLVKSGMEHLNKKTFIEKLNLNLHPL